MTDIQIKNAILQATETVRQNDLWLLQNDTSEQSISHRIAHHVQPLFTDYHVDCEYNGDIDRDNNKKSISILKYDLQLIGLLRTREADDLEREYTNRAVFPDIIIHKRGTNESNLCIIEVKKSSSTVPYEYDYIKLRSYTSENYENNLKYKLGVFIEVIINGNNSNFNFRYFKNGQEVNEPI